MCWRDDFCAWGVVPEGPLPEPLYEEPKAERERRPASVPGGRYCVATPSGIRLTNEPPAYLAFVPAEPKKRTAPYSSSQLRHWRKKVLRRDGGCVVCGETEALHAHHIKPRSTYPELALDVENGEARCRLCHHAAHPELPAVLFA